MALKLASESLPALSGVLSGRKYNMLGRIVTHWADIVGADMAAKTSPGKLKYKSKKGQKPEFTLEIGTSSADATVMSYRIDLILARISQILGEGVITSIRFVPLVANTVSTPVVQKRKKPLSQEKKDYIQDAIEDVEDSELQERLQSLGTMILQDEQSSS